jgi:hypothetical protein
MIDSRAGMPEALFPPGTPVVVRQTVERRGRSYQIEVVGVIVEWSELPTGSWYAHGRKDKLWLRRLMLRKIDGEQTLLVVDGHSAIAKLEAAKASK